MAGLMAYVYWLCFGCGYNRLLSTDEKKKRKFFVLYARVEGS